MEPPIADNHSKDLAGIGLLLLFILMWLVIGIGAYVSNYQEKSTPPILTSHEVKNETPTAK